MKSAIAALGAIPLSKWPVFICPFLAGFECPLTDAGARLIRRVLERKYLERLEVEE
jgi:hypothetical protein